MLTRETSLSYLLLKEAVEIQSEAERSSVTHPRPEEQCQPRIEPGSQKVKPVSAFSCSRFLSSLLKYLHPPHMRTHRPTAQD